MRGKFGECDDAARSRWDAGVSEALRAADNARLMPFSMEELVAAAAELKRNKASGADSVNAELLSQLLFSDVAGELLFMFNDIFTRQQPYPADWRKHVAVLVPKISRPETGKHLRPIVLSSVLQKLYAKILWRRLEPKVAVYRGGQTGCRPHCQAAEAVSACRGLIDKAREWKTHLLGAKLDVAQAFDRVHRHVLLEVLRPACGDAPHEVLAVAEVLLQSDVHFAVAGETWVCPMARGVVQGGTLSASLFSLAVDDLCHRLQERWQLQGHLAPLSVERVKQWMWAYADDLILFACNVAQLSRLLSDVKNELRAMGLEINVDKTQVIAAPWTAEPGTLVQLAGDNFQVASRITYLGLPVGFHVTILDMGQALLARAWRAFFQYRSVLCHRGVNVDRRLSLLNTYVTNAWAWAACHCRPIHSPWCILFTRRGCPWSPPSLASHVIPQTSAGSRTSYAAVVRPECMPPRSASRIGVICLFPECLHGGGMWQGCRLTGPVQQP